MEKLEGLTENEILKIGIKRGQVRSTIAILTIMLGFIILIYINDKDNFKKILVASAIMGPISLIVAFKLQKIAIKYHEHLRNKIIDDTKKYLLKNR